LANGCLCCSVKAEFVQALEALLAADGGHEGKFDYVLVETTGEGVACVACVPCAACVARAVAGHVVAAWDVGCELLVMLFL
jgi:hypothetical protein